MHDEDTTPLARTAALFHEAGRVSDTITCGPQYAKSPWEAQTPEAKQRVIDLVTRARSETFEEFWEFYTLPERMTGQPVPQSADETDYSLVRHARMLHSIAHGLLPNTVKLAPVTETG